MVVTVFHKLQCRCEIGESELIIKSDERNIDGQQYHTIIVEGSSDLL